MIDFLPQELCTDLDAEISQIFDESQNAAAVPAGKIVDHLASLESIEKGEDEELIEFQIRMYTAYQEAGLEPILPDFQQPIFPYPASCGQSNAFNNLAGLIAATTDALTYERFLADRLAGSCSGVEIAVQTVFDDVMNQIDATAV